jgi:hypothetical protein
MHRDASISRIRYTLVTAVVAALLLPALATAKDHPRGAGKSRQVERLRQIEKQRLQALAAPTALARPADTPPAVAKATAAAQPKQEARSHEENVGAYTPGAIPAVSYPSGGAYTPGATPAVSYPRPVAPARAVQAPDSSGAVSATTIGLGIAGSLLAICAIAGIVNRTRRTGRAGIAA